MINLVTFADSRMKHSLRRIEKQAKSLNIFDNVFVFDETDLNLEFIELCGNRLSHSYPGFGYWVWKPQVVLQALEKMQAGDCLIYVDAGCHLNPRGIQRLKEYFEIVERSDSGILGFEMEFNGHFMREEQWTKGAVFDYFQIPYKSHIATSAQIIGGIFLIQKRDNVVEFLRRWLSLMILKPELVDDSVSSWNYDSFITHRHDQSIFSIMSKLCGISLLSHSENFPAEHNSDGNPQWEMLNDYPIWAKRDKLSRVQHLRILIAQKIKTIFPKLDKKF